MALVMPLLVMLVFGTVDFGLLIYNKAVITNAAREGARAGIVYAPSPGVDRLTTAQVKTVVPTTAARYLITFGSHVLSASDVTVVNGGGAVGHRAEGDPHVPSRVRGHLRLSCRGCRPNVTLTSTSVMRIE